MERGFLLRRARWRSSASPGLARRGCARLGRRAARALPASSRAPPTERRTVPLPRARLALAVIRCRTCVLRSCACPAARRAVRARLRARYAIQTGRGAPRCRVRGARSARRARVVCGFVRRARRVARARAASRPARSTGCRGALAPARRGSRVEPVPVCLGCVRPRRLDVSEPRRAKPAAPMDSRTKRRCPVVRGRAALQPQGAVIDGCAPPEPRRARRTCVASAMETDSGRQTCRAAPGRAAWALVSAPRGRAIRGPSRARA
jgi:hypothetical protein